MTSYCSNVASSSAQIDPPGRGPASRACAILGFAAAALGMWLLAAGTSAQASSTLYAPRGALTRSPSTAPVTSARVLKPHQVWPRGPALLPPAAAPPDHAMPQGPGGASSPASTAVAHVLVAKVLGALGVCLGLGAAALSWMVPRRSGPPVTTARTHADWWAGAAAAAALGMGATGGPAVAALPSYDLVTDPNVLLEENVPMETKEIVMIAKELEDVQRQLRAAGQGAPPVDALREELRDVTRLTLQDGVRGVIVEKFDESKANDGLVALEAFEDSISRFKDALRTAKDTRTLVQYEERALEALGNVEDAMAPQFPFEIPPKYARLPRLMGRATVECELRLNGSGRAKRGLLTLVLDGYNAPLTAGNFMDLVNKKFYDGMPIQRADGFVVQTGQPKGPAEGFVDPRTKRVRRIPLEVRVTGDRDPYYEATLEDLGIYNQPLQLPFNAMGTMAMAHTDGSPNSASSQFFWLLKDSELTPTGGNVLDGRYGVFGYVVEGADLLTELQVGDKIECMQVISGHQKFVPGDPKAPEVSFEGSS